MSGVGPAHRRIRVAAGVTWRGGEVLITQRPPGGLLGLMWEFPGGKLEPGESPEQALERELREELGVAATATRVLKTETHAYAHGLEVEIAFVECVLASHAFVPSAEVHASRWLEPADIAPGDLLEGDRGFLRQLVAGEYRPAGDSR